MQATRGHQSGGWANSHTLADLLKNIRERLDLVSHATITLIGLGDTSMFRAIIIAENLDSAMDIINQGVDKFI